VLARGELQQTRDGGAHWAPAMPGVARTTIHQLVVEGGAGPVMLAHTAAGVSISHDEGRSWAPLDTGGAFDATGVRRLFSDEAGGTFVWTKTGLFRRTTADRSWRRVAIEAERDVKLAFARSEPAFVYAIGDQTLRVSRDGGRAWSPLPTPLDGQVFGSLSVAPAPHDPSKLMIGGRCLMGPCAVWRSVNAGASWEQVFSTAEHAMPTLAPVWDPVDPKTIYVLVDNIGVGGGGGLAHKSVDGGATWSEVSLRGLIYYFTVLPTRPSTVFAQTPDFSGRGRYLLHRSTDAGRSWTDSQAGLARDETVTAMAVDPRDPRRVYAAVDTRGLFVSADGGASWLSTAAR
jgi:photosystem II stability/assembly factor-like uncharacterized protein